MMTIVHENDGHLTNLNTDLHYFSDEDEWEGDDFLSDDSFGDEDASDKQAAHSVKVEMVEESESDDTQHGMDLSSLNLALEEEENVFGLV